MARGVRFTKPEREWLLKLVELSLSLELVPTVTKRLAESVRAKFLASEQPAVKATGLSVTVAIEAFREVLGRRLVVPPNGATPIFIQMTRRLGALGLTHEDCVAIAKTAAMEWRGPVKAQSIINQAEALLQKPVAMPHKAGVEFGLGGAAEMDEL